MLSRLSVPCSHVILDRLSCANRSTHIKSCPTSHTPPYLFNTHSQRLRLLPTIRVSSAKLSDSVKSYQLASHHTSQHHFKSVSISPVQLALLQTSQQNPIVAIVASVPNRKHTPTMQQRPSLTVSPGVLHPFHLLTTGFTPEDRVSKLGLVSLNHLAGGVKQASYIAALVRACSCQVVPTKVVGA